MNNVFLFPGQGSQVVGMGKDLAAEYPLARTRYAEAADILGFDLAKVSFEGPEEELRLTRATQPALYVHSCVVAELLAERDILPVAAAGHSLGEYSALCTGGALSFADGLRLVKERAEAMQHAAETNPGTMAAIVGLDDDVLREVCREAESVGVVVPANFNSPGQTVISGVGGAVRKAMEIARVRGAKMVRELPVSGAFHSPQMRPAADRLAKALAAARLFAPRITVISNVTAKPHTDSDSMRRLLTEQLLSPVRWTETLQELAAISDVRWIEVGSGNVLSGLLKRTITGALATPVGTVQDLNNIATES